MGPVRSRGADQRLTRDVDGLQRQPDVLRPKRQDAEHQGVFDDATFRSRAAVHAQDAKAHGKVLMTHTPEPQEISLYNHTRSQI